MTKILIGRGDTDLDYPICRPSLDLDFTQEELDPRITFTRGSIGTRVNRNRLIETVAANQPRFDYDPVTGECRGLLIEESRQNLLTYSSEFNTNWTKIGLSISPNSAISPDGTTTAIKQVETTASGLHRNGQGVSKSAVATTYTFSIFAKAGERNGFEFGISDAGGYVDCFPNLTNGSFTGVPVINGSFILGSYGSIQYPNDWYRFYVTATTTAQTGVNVFYGTTLAPGFVNNYTGDGTSGIYIWGAQLEAGAFATSHIPTTVSTVSRSTDLARIIGTNFSSWYNSNEGTLYASARISALGGGGYPGIVYVDDGTLNNCIGLVFMDATNDVIAAEAYASAANQYFLNSPVATIPNQLTKGITAYQQNNFAAAFSNRTSVASDRNGVVPTVNRMIIGDLRGGNGRLNGTISRITYWPRRFKDNQLQYLTQ
jgi:hypothetical protein